MTSRSHLVVLVGALLLLGILIVLGLRYHWTLALPVAGLLRFVEWLARGVYCTVPVLAAGTLVLSPLRRDADTRPPALAVSLSWGAGWALVIAVGLITLATGLYTPLLWQVLAVVGWVGLVIWLGARGWSPIVRLWERLRARSWTGPPLISWQTLLLAMAAMVVLHASIPPDTRDELAYHLVMPQLWAFQGDWWLPTDNFHLAFPANAELVWGWAGAVGGPLGPRFVTLVFALLTVALLWQCLDSLGTAAWIRDVSLVVLVSAPMVLASAAACYVEWPLMFFLLLGWRLAVSPEAFGGRPAICVTAVAWAVALGMKYTAALFVGPLVVEWLVRRGRIGAGRVLSAALAIVLAAAALAMPWYLRNWASTGDPVYPLGGAVGLAADHDHAANLAEYVELEGLWKWFPWLYHATADPTSDHRLHPLWPLLLLLVLVLGWRWRRELPWFTVVVATASMLPFQPAPRVALPLLLLCTLFLPRLLAPLTGGRAGPPLVTAAVLVVAVVSVPISTHYLLLAGGPAVPEYLLGLSDRDAFLRDRDLITPAVRWFHDHSPKEARLWTWCEDRTLYFERWARGDSPYGPAAFLATLAAGGPPALTDATREVDFVVLHHDRCPASWGITRFEKRSWQIDPSDRDALTAWSADHLVEVLHDDRYTVYRVRK